jgi:hypothetical protein
MTSIAHSFERSQALNVIQVYLFRCRNPACARGWYTDAPRAYRCPACQDHLAVESLTDLNEARPARWEVCA